MISDHYLCILLFDKCIINFTVQLLLYYYMYDICHRSHSDLNMKTPNTSIIIMYQNNSTIFFVTSAPNLKLKTNLIH